MISIEYVQNEVEQIRQTVNRRDNEVAHAREDGLLLEVLDAIADGHPKAQELAREALKITKIYYTRWYA